MKSDTSLFAAIDLGSNAFRLMIGQPVKRSRQIIVQEVKTLREPVRLSEGLQGGALDELALDRGWQALARFGKSCGVSKRAEYVRWPPAQFAKPTMRNCSSPAPSGTWGFVST